MNQKCNKQAILILAYMNFDRVERICRFFQDESFVVFIHVDRKTHLSTETRNSLEKYHNVRILSKRYKTNWGGFNLSLAILELMRAAVEISSVFYIHLIDEASYPIKSLQFFKSYVHAKKNCEMIEVGSFCTNRECDDRMRYYYLHDYLNLKTWIGRITSSFFVKLQILFSFRRASYDSKLMKGESAFSLSRSAVSYILDYLDCNRDFLKRFQYTHAPDECIFATLIAYSPYKDKIIGKHRYIDWSARFTANYKHPAILSMAHLDEILLSNDLFARKFVSPQSDSLQTAIDNALIVGHMEESALPINLD